MTYWWGLSWDAQREGALDRWEGHQEGHRAQNLGGQGKDLLGDHSWAVLLQGRRALDLDRTGLEGAADRAGRTHRRTRSPGHSRIDHSHNRPGTDRTADCTVVVVVVVRR